jgi:transposase InsO family protein
MILERIDEAVEAGARLAPACDILGLSARTVQRWREQGGGEDRREGPRREPANKLTPAERRRLLAAVNSPEYRDLSPKQIVPRLADLGTYLGSESTVYRLLRDEGQLTHREPSRPASARRPREWVASGPGEVWSWDITYLKSPVRGQFYYLYLITDVWSRKVVGWAVHTEESTDHASELFCDTCVALDLDPDGVVLHSDNGGPMKGSTMLATLERLGVVASFSRPRVSDDNPYSEALFRTMKYRPDYPTRPFANVEETTAWVVGFVTWYNTEHRHSAIRFVTPDERHFGREAAILKNRERVYERARRRRPERWTGATRNWKPIGDVHLNPEKRPEERDKFAEAA